MNYSPYPDSDDDRVEGAAPTSEQNVSGSASTHSAMEVRRRQVPAVRPEVIIEIPAPPARRARKYVWLGAAVFPLVVTVIALAALAGRSQNLSATIAQEATVEARVEQRLAEERGSVSASPPTAVLESTVEARVATRLAQERAVRTVQGPTQPAGEPTVQLTTGSADPVADSGGPAPFIVQAEVLLNLRQGPGQTQAVVGRVEQGQEIRLLGRTIDSGWLLVSIEESIDTEKRGWVAGWLVVDEDGNEPDLSPLPVVSALSLSTRSE